MSLESSLRIVPNFPKEGIDFIDISPILEDPELFQTGVQQMSEKVDPSSFSKMVALESRGFIFAAALSQKLNKGFSMVRKPGKLPGKTKSYSYDLEYGSDTLEILEDSVKPGEKFLVVDDVLATGGTAQAAAELITQAGGIVSGYLFFIELAFLNGRSKLNSNVDSLIVRN